MSVPSVIRVPRTLQWPKAGPNEIYLARVWAPVSDKINAAPTMSNGVALAAIVVGGSPFTYTNEDGFDENIVVSGGTVSAIHFIRGGVSTLLGVTSGVFHLSPMDGLQVTYSGLPTMIKVPW